MGVFSGKETEKGYKTSLFHKTFLGRVSGNLINGLGETKRRRPRPVYHDQHSWHPWRIVQDAFYVRQAFWGFSKYIRVAIKLDNRELSPISPTRVEDSPENWSLRVKQAALDIGADVVGIARLDPEWVYEGEQVNEPWIIVLGSRMNYEKLNETTNRKFRISLSAIMETYNKGHSTAVELADWIRRQGWYARGYGNPNRTAVSMIPAAIGAGLGELGKHGSLINRKLGANMRLAYVLTELPVTPDAIDIFGADDFCQSCRLCTKECPPYAISDDKRLVRGVERWYVDFDRCVPYFNDNLGCGICLAVCPWSRPGVAERLTEKMLQRSQSLAKTSSQ
jgi:ferredoxin